MKYYFFYFLLISTTIFSQKNPLKHVDFHSINDVDFSVFENPKYANFYRKKINTTAFFKQYFSVWNDKKQEISETEYGDFFTYPISKKSPCIGENYKPLNNEVISEITENIKINRQDIGKTILLGITIKTADIRYLPTDEFCFKNVRNAGEGYPFDYFQNSNLWLGTPVSILAISKDQMWYFINSHNNKGWVKSSEIAILNRKTADTLQKMDFLTPINDKVIVKSTFEATKIHLGCILPSITKNDTTKVFLPKKNERNQLYFKEVTVSKTNFKEFPIEFNAKNVKHILSELVNHKYTWGGINEGRDCSSTLKDFYTPFGLWLPRNSKQQKTAGKQLNLTGNSEEKLRTVTNEGIPFLSTIYKPGHIVLYLGLSKKNNTPIIFQNVWGIKAYYKKKTLFKLAKQKEKYGIFGIHNKNKITNTRFVIGKAVITNIEPSKKLNSFKHLTTESFLTNFKTLTLLKL